MFCALVRVWLGRVFAALGAGAYCSVVATVPWDGGWYYAMLGRCSVDACSTAGTGPGPTPQAPPSPTCHSRGEARVSLNALTNWHFGTNTIFAFSTGVRGEDKTIGYWPGADRYNLKPSLSNI